MSFFSKDTRENTLNGNARSESKVFVIGYSRTGTSSTTEALRMLGYKSVHYPLSVITLEGDSVALVPERVEPFDALSDAPIAHFYKELDALFPGSKFILTVRDTESWYNSMLRLNTSYRYLRMFPRIRTLVEEMFGTDSYLDKEKLCAAYKAHNDSVRAYFRERPEDLLVLDIRSDPAWEMLADFLKKPVPHETPFPWKNKRYRTSFKNIYDFLLST